ncbi:MAG: substrate-binding domain-containing protein [Methanomicrobiaceae archaeon]|nr:substrate-binding domain-containing protein [Methanomicrobiaceae archaeon]
MTRRHSILCVGALVMVLLAAGIVSVSAILPTEDENVLIIATTTSLEDTGLLAELEMQYENITDIDVRVTAQGTGQALETASRGDADMVMVHSPPLEEQFIADGYGTNARCFAYNYFEIVGPADDPAGIEGMSPEEALATIYNEGQAGTEGVAFASRGDNSGTHNAEITLWEAAGYNYTEDVRDVGPWYLETGSGMGETLTFANEQNAYTLTDKGTFLAFQANLDLVPLVTEGDVLLNRYSAIAVNPDTVPGVNFEEANAFIEWLISDDTKEFIGNFGVEQYGEALFTPLYPPECSEAPFNCTCTSEGAATPANESAM